MTAPKRLRPSKAVEHQVRDECGQACANPDCRVWNTATHELHHIDGDRSNSIADNLILLCANCHHQATAAVFPPDRIGIWKSMARVGSLPGQRGKLPVTAPVVARDNFGIAATTIQNLTYHAAPKKKGRAPTIILPGSIGSSTKHYNYTESLIKKLTKFRQAGKSFGQKRSGKIHDGGTRAILAQELGGLPKDLGLQRFEEVCKVIKGKIDATALGSGRKKRDEKNYSSFEEFLASGRG